MCSGCGRCGKVGTDHHSVLTSLGSIDFVQIASPGSGLQMNIVPAPGAGSDLVNLRVPSAQQRSDI